jgi:hypothetical protein
MPSSSSTLDRLAERIPFGARVAGVWLGLLALMLLGTYASVALHAFWPDAVPGLKGLFRDELIAVPFWILLTTLAVFAARRLSGRWAIPIHAAIAISIGVTHDLLSEPIARRLFHITSADVEFAHWALWDVLVYAAIVLVAHSHDLGDWVRAKMREEVTLNEEVLRATSRLTRLRETQSVLLASLNDVIASPTMETLDRAVVDFADFLRIDVMAGVTE